MPVNLRPSSRMTSTRSSRITCRFVTTMPSERQMTPAPWLPPRPTSTTDGLISAATSAIASESASPARAGARGIVTARVCSRSRVIDMSMLSALFGLALALADGNRDLTRLSTAGDADRDALANAVPRELLLKLLDLTDGGAVDGQDDVAEHQPGRVRGTAGFDGDDEQTQFLTAIEGASQRLRQTNALSADAKIAAADPTMLKQRGDGGIDGGRQHRQLSGAAQGR